MNKKRINTYFDSIRDGVKYVLTTYPKTRNDDRMLHALYLRDIHGVTTFKQYAMNPMLPALATILRRRQEIQEEGELLPTDDAVVQKRQTMSRAGINAKRRPL